MKRTSPMKARNHENMEDYSKRRKSELGKKAPRINIAEVRPLIMHDPEGDLHHLMRAAEVKQDKKRHKDALKVAQIRMQGMKNVMGGSDK